MYCMPRRWRISSAKIADPSGAPNSTVNAAAIPAMVTPRASSTESRRLPRDPTRERSAGRDERRFGTGRAAGRDRQQRHRDRATAGCARRARCPTRGCCRRAVRRRRGCRAHGRSRRPRPRSRPAPRTPPRGSRGRARARAAADGTRGGKRRRRAPLASPTTTVAPSSAGDMPERAAIEIAPPDAVPRNISYYDINRYDRGLCRPAGCDRHGPD